MTTTPTKTPTPKAVPWADSARPPVGGPSDALFSNSSMLAPIPLQTAPPVVRPDPYIQCFNPQLPRSRAAGRGQLIEELPPDRTDMTPDVLGMDEDSRGSLGTSVQLMAVGAQNYVLDLNPQMSFFKAVFKRHTDFATECYEDAVTGARFGQTSTVEIGRRGDMLGDMFLQVTLPNLNIPGGTWADAIGYVLLTRVRVVVDDTVVHDQERLWYDLTDKLFMPHGRRLGVDAMIGRGRTLATDKSHTVLVPFKFAWCTGHYTKRQLLPIAALATKSRLTLHVSFESLANCVVLPTGVSLSESAPVSPLLAVSVLSEQTFVAQDEQRAIMGAPITMLVEVAQDVDALTYRFDDTASYDLAAAQLDLRELNLPVKLLAFVAYDENDASRGRFFNYLDCVSKAVLLVNSSERFSPQPGAYFSLMQTHRHCTRSAPDLVHAYSFALDAGERQPCGSLNFAVLDRPTLRVELQNTRGRAIKVKAFAYCYNWLSMDAGSLAMRLT